MTRGSVTFREAFWYWLKLGFISFGGPTGQIAMMHKEVEALRRDVNLASALMAITAAVVGVVLNLGVTFTYHTLVPDTGGFEWYALIASLIAFFGMQYRKWPMIPVIIGSAFTGLIWKTTV